LVVRSRSTRSGVITDLAIDRARPSRAIAVTSTAEHGAFHVILAETLDDGATWNQAGGPSRGTSSR